MTPPRFPPAPTGFVACRTHDGEQKLIPLGAARQITHLVRLLPDEHGRLQNGGRPTMCGLTRFDTDGRRADLPGWYMGDGGVSGPDVEQITCPDCYRAAENTEAA